MAATEFGRYSGSRLKNILPQASVLTVRRVVWQMLEFAKRPANWRHRDSSSLDPKIGICILSSLMFPNVPAGHLTFTLSNLQHGIHFTDHFQIHTVELPKYNGAVSNCPVGASLEKWAWLFQRAKDQIS